MSIKAAADFLTKAGEVMQTPTTGAVAAADLIKAAGRALMEESSKKRLIPIEIVKDGYGNFMELRPILAGELIPASDGGWIQRIDGTNVAHLAPDDVRWIEI